MTFYQQIQRALDQFEQDPYRNMTIEALAQQSAMSVATFYRYFGAMTGYTVKEYLRRRRLSRSLELLEHHQLQVIDIAFLCGFKSHEAYTRAFNKEFGQTPNEYRRGSSKLQGIKPIQLVEELTMGLVIKQLERMAVASYRVISCAPEADAWRHIDQWAKQNQVYAKPYRCFGYNRPNPFEAEQLDGLDAGEYGYEVMIAYDISCKPRFAANGRGVKQSNIAAGRFAVLSIGTNCQEQDIEKGWQTMQKLLDQAGFKTTGRWFEEHIEFSSDTDSVPKRLDLYVEIED